MLYQPHHPCTQPVHKRESSQRWSDTTDRVALGVHNSISYACCKQKRQGKGAERAAHPSRKAGWQLRSEPSSSNHFRATEMACRANANVGPPGLSATFTWYDYSAIASQPLSFFAYSEISSWHIRKPVHFTHEGCFPVK